MYNQSNFSFLHKKLSLLSICPVSYCRLPIQDYDLEIPQNFLKSILTSLEKGVETKSSQRWVALFTEILHHIKVMQNNRNQAVVPSAAGPANEWVRKQSVDTAAKNTWQSYSTTTVPLPLLKTYMQISTHWSKKDMVLPPLNGARQCSGVSRIEKIRWCTHLSTTMVTVVSVKVVKLPVATAINGLFSALTISSSPTEIPTSHNAVNDLTANSNSDMLLFQHKWSQVST